MAKGFQFKQFFIAHDKCAMKVNTDAVILGSLADSHEAKHILDLGTGTGIIALMLAQRSNAQVTAVELENNAYQQAQENCKNSPFSNRLHLIQQDILSLNLDQKFDLIVANPPYFEHSLKAKNEPRTLARAVQQSHLQWLEIAYKHLTPTGKISFILPSEAAIKLISQCEKTHLHCTEQWHIHTKKHHIAKRMIVTFQHSNLPCITRHFTVYDEHHQYTDEFKMHTKDFYLNF